MTKRHLWGDLTQKIVDACSTKDGASMAEIAKAIERSSQNTGVMVGQIAARGYIFRGGIKFRYRYFASQEAAQYFDRELSPIIEAQRLEEIKAKQREKNARNKRQARANKRAKKGLPAYDPAKPETFVPSNSMKAKQKKKMLDMTPKKSGIVISNREGELQNKKANIAAKIVWPEHVKVQVVPGYRGDTRFQFTPEPGWRGAITEDWINRRMAASC